MQWDWIGKDAVCKPAHGSYDYVVRLEPYLKSYAHKTLGYLQLQYLNCWQYSERHTSQWCDWKMCKKLSTQHARLPTVSYTDNSHYSETPICEGIRTLLLLLFLILFLENSSWKCNMYVIF